MKTVFTIILAITVAITSAQDLTTVKSFPTNGNDYSIVALESSSVAIEKWDESFIRIQTQISDANIPEKVLMNLVSAGFFNIVVEEDGDGLRIHFPNKDKEVTITGKKLVYSTSYKIFVPQNHVAEIYKGSDAF